MPNLRGVERSIVRWGLKVKVHNIPGRPGLWDCKGVMGHHTASTVRRLTPGRITPSLNTIIRGRDTIPGPLSQFYIGYDRVVHIISYGRANHAGAGGPWRNIPANSGNAYLCGIEVENTGNRPLDIDMLETERRLVCAILQHIGRDPSWYLLHKTWAPGRKPDIAGIDIARERAILQNMLNVGPAKPSNKDRELSPEEMQELKNFIYEVVEARFASLSYGGKRENGRIVNGAKVDAPGNNGHNLSEIYKEVRAIRDRVVGPGN